MSQQSLVKGVFALLAVVVLGVALAACGGGDSSTGSTEESGTGSAISDSGGAGVAARAAEEVSAFIGTPSPFPVTEPLREVPKGASVLFVDSGAPVGALQWELLGPAAATMGVDVERVTAGVTAASVNAAMDSVIAKKPDMVLVNGIPIELWANELEQLQDDGVTVTASGIYGIEELGVRPMVGNEPYGEMMAKYVIGEMNPHPSVSLYTTPEVPTIKRTGEEFEAEFEALCPDCPLRTVPIRAEAIGNTAPSAIVSDLQANTGTDVAVFGADEMQAGLPAALQVAGIEVETLGLAPTPINLQYLKEGKETAALGYDIAVGMWTELDQAARLMTGQELSGPEARGYGVTMFLTPEDITFDPSKGWSGYPDFAERFAKLWGVG